MSYKWVTKKAGFTILLLINQTKTTKNDNLLSVLGAGLEPVRPCGH